MEDLTTIIEDSLTDAATQDLPETPSEPVEAPVEAAPEAVVPETPAPVEPTVEDPTAPVVDEFEKRYGIPSQSTTGRENRIPYSRVKKIVEKAILENKTDWTRGLETSHVTAEKFKELDTKVKDYEERLKGVSEFEHIMTTDHARFLGMLNTVPGYKDILAPLFGPPPPPQGQRTLADAVVPPPSGEMPQPDQKMADGSMVYSMDGLNKLLQWQSKQVEDRITKQVEAKYKPIEESYNSYQKVQSVLPVVQRQIAEARTWPLFNESEDDIVKILKDNPSFSLERAYQHVVLPKLQSNRDQIRQDVLKEIKAAPRSTSVPTTAVKAAPVASSGPKSLEDVIAESIKSAGLK
jgi:hypothetical protein